VKVKSFFRFFKPRLVNILLTLFVLCLPLLREQYNNGQYVTWHRPIVVFADYLRGPRNYQPLIMMFVLTLVIYLAVSVILAIFRITKDKN